MSKSRNDRRSKTVTVGGMRVNAHKFSIDRAKILPRMIDKSTGKAINHEENLKAIFDVGGKEGVEHYVKSVYAVSVRDRGGFKNKLKGNWLILKAKLRLKIK